MAKSKSATFRTDHSLLSGFAHRLNQLPGDFLEVSSPTALTELLLTCKRHSRLAPHLSVPTCQLDYRPSLVSSSCLKPISV